MKCKKSVEEQAVLEKLDGFVFWLLISGETISFLGIVFHVYLDALYVPWDINPLRRVSWITPLSDANCCLMSLCSCLKAWLHVCLCMLCDACVCIWNGAEWLQALKLESTIQMRSEELYVKTAIHQTIQQWEARLNGEDSIFNHSVKLPTLRVSSPQYMTYRTVKWIW